MDTDPERILAICTKALVSVACIFLIFSLAFCKLGPTIVVKPPPASVTVVASPLAGTSTPSPITAPTSAPPPTGTDSDKTMSAIEMVALVIGLVWLLLLATILVQAIIRPAGTSPRDVADSKINRLAAFSAVAAAGLPQIGESLGELKFLVTVIGAALALTPIVLRFIPTRRLKVLAILGEAAAIAAIGAAWMSRDYHVLDEHKQWAKDHHLQTGWAWLHESIANLQPDATVSVTVLLGILCVNLVIAVVTGNPPPTAAVGTEARR